MKPLPALASLITLVNRDRVAWISQDTQRSRKLSSPMRYGQTPGVQASACDSAHQRHAEGYAVERWLAVDNAGQRSPWRRFPGFANFIGEQGLIRLRGYFRE